ncbi:MAG: MmgE/PrpD family protein [Pseudomonadota bacterium]
MNDYLDEMSTMVANTDVKNLNKQIGEQTCFALMDVLGTIMAGGFRSKEVKKLAKVVACPLSGKSTMLVEKFPSAAAPQAALVNGCAGTWLELEEGNRIARGHPGIHVLPAAIAVAQEMNVTGEEFLNAFFVGYETAARIGAASILRPGFHPHGTWGTIGAAAAVARLMKMNKDKIREVINVAAGLTLSAPFSTATGGATVRNLFAGIAGTNGILAAQAVNAGFTGLNDGPREVFSHLTGNRFDPSSVAEIISEKWLIEVNYFKPHGFCRHNHAAIEALMAIKELQRISPEEVTRVVIYTHAPASDMGEKNPRNGLAARFSVPYSVVARLVLGRSDEAATSKHALTNGTIRKLLEVTEIYEDKAYTKRYPRFRDGRVELFLKDGRVLVGRCENPPGDMDIDPLSRGIVEDKFLRLSQPLLGEGNTELLSRCKAVGELEDVNDLFDGF